jgi:hypothetical protein
VFTSKTSRILLILALLVVLAVGGGAGAVAAGVKSLAPARLALHYPWNILAQEADTMNDCVECHEPADFHTCEACHDDHGAIEMASVPFNSLLLLTGDVPAPGYVPINEILPYREQPNTHVPLLDFLAEHGVTDFESVTLTSRDGGFITFERPNLTPEAWLTPHVDGVRFAAENLHVSTWLKGVWQIIVVGTDRPLQIDGQPTSIGRLLVGPTRSVTVEQTDVMLKSETDGQIRQGKTASRLEGAPIEAIVDNLNFQQLLVHDRNGREHVLTAEETQGAVLAQIRGQVTLVLPERSRAQWVADVVEIVSQR